MNVPPEQFSWSRFPVRIRPLRQLVEVVIQRLLEDLRERVVKPPREHAVTHEIDTDGCGPNTTCTCIHKSLWVDQPSKIGWPHGESHIEDDPISSEPTWEGR